MISMGMVLGDRYQILDKIGTGGMSDVYKALDQKLNRFVAVKILKPEYSEDTNFVSKFRVEAQAAAGLMHPNIVNVYDVGEDNGVHFIVMELVEGITLKKYIEKKVRLTSKEAISIAIQVAYGIEAAHNNHIIHRDIKPQNIIISKEGKVKVTDFGIAKAVSSNTNTSNAMGSVHYISPEQVRGGYSDEKSDIYSLGITMFEMVTGRVPFSGDTTVAIAIKHIQEQMPSPRLYAADIPVSLEKIILKCTQKNADRRYQNMSDIVADLKRSLMNPDEDFVQIDDMDEAGKTKIAIDTNRSFQRDNMAERTPKREVYANFEDLEKIPVKKVRTDTMTAQTARKKTSYQQSATKPQTSVNAAQKSSQTRPAGKNTTSQSAAKKTTKRNPDIYYEEPRPRKKLEEGDDFDYNPAMDRVITAITVIIAIVVGCIILFLVVNSSGIFDDTTTIETQDTVVFGTEESTTTQEGISVPYVVGLTEAEGTAQLKAESFTVTKTEAYSSEYAKGTIISQSVEGTAPIGSEIALVISQGSEEVEVEMPDVLGYTLESATSMIEAAGLVVGDVEDSYSAEYAEDEVCYQGFEAGTKVSQGTVVDLKVSIGMEETTYRCSISVQAPADYSGGNAEVILTTADGVTQLWYNQNVTSFPVNINLSGFDSTSDYGVIFITYLKNVEQIITDADGNQTTQIVQEVTQTQQNVQFIKE